MKLVNQRLTLYLHPAGGSDYPMDYPYAAVSSKHIHVAYTISDTWGIRYSGRMLGPSIDYAMNKYERQCQHGLI